MKQYVPITNYSRHKTYLPAFNHSIKMNKYLEMVRQFIMDKDISPHNEDDLQFLKDLLFETKFGRNHIYFYDYICSNKNITRKNIKVLSKYADFLSSMSDYFLEDMFYYMLKTKNKDLISKYFSKLSSRNQVKFAKFSSIYPTLINKLPKVKTYMIFS